MTTSVPSKIHMGPEAKLYKKLKTKTSYELSGQGLKTLAYLGALIYWGIMLILGTFSLLN